MKKVFLLSAFVLGFSACTQDNPRVMIPADPPVEKVANDGVEVFDPRVDILFIIDNSGSMYSHQTNLSNNINRFLNNFISSGNLDFHIGILTTDDDAWGSRNCCGKLVGFPTFVDRNTPNLLSVLANNMMVGTNGSAYEKVFDPLISALSPPNLTGINAGFYRPDVPLAVIFITDAEDQSNATPDTTLNFLSGLKPRPEFILGYGVIIPSSDHSGGCYRDENRGPQRIEYFLSKVSNAPDNVMHLCAPDYGDKLAEMGNDLRKRVGNTIYLARPAVVESIQVTFGTQIIPPDFKKGWSFDYSKNAVILGDEIEWTEQPQGTKVRVNYEAAVIK